MNSRSLRRPMLALAATLGTVAVAVAVGVSTATPSARAASVHPHLADFANHTAATVDAAAAQRVSARVRVLNSTSGKPLAGWVWLVDQHGARVSGATRLSSAGWATVGVDPPRNQTPGKTAWHVAYGATRGAAALTSTRSINFTVSDSRPYTFAASPDFLNIDLGDVSGLPGYDAANGNSWNAQTQRSVDQVLDTIAARKPGAFLITGDFVNGRWGSPNNTTGVFGTPANQASMAAKQAAFYHGKNVELLKSHGLFRKSYEAVGDHELGDNPWDNNSGAWVSWKRKHIGIFRRAFANAYTRKADGSPKYGNRPVGTQWSNTAYATKINPQTLLVTVDEFDRTSSDVHVTVTGGQLTWLDHVLRRARAHGVKWIIVQGHTPVLTPVRARGSSELHVEDGAKSAFWKTMVKYHVNLYIAGEVHNTTRVTKDGVTQITTGGPVTSGWASYTMAKMYRDQIRLTTYEWNVPANDRTGPLWQGGCPVKEMSRASCAWPPTISAARDYTGYSAQKIGTLTVYDTGRATTGSGKLAPYNPAHDPYAG